MQDPADEVLRLATLEDLPAIAAFLPELAGPHYSQRFPGRTGVEFLDWKYHRNPTGAAIVGVATVAGRLASTVAAVPTRLQIGDRVVLAYNLGDFLTGREFRKRGLFTRLVDFVREEAMARGAELLYVQPNDSSYPILARRSFEEPYPLTPRRLPIPSRILSRKLHLPTWLATGLGLDGLALRLSLPSRRDGSIVVEAASAFDDRMDTFWEGARRGYRFLAVRDRERLQWRFADCPTPYRILIARRGEDVVGYLVTFADSETGEAYVVDLFTHDWDQAAAVELLRRGVGELTRERAGSINAWTVATPSPSMNDGLLRRVCRFSSRPSHFALQFLNAPAPENWPGVGWRWAMGDFDGV